MTSSIITLSPVEYDIPQLIILFQEEHTGSCHIPLLQLKSGVVGSL